MRPSNVDRGGSPGGSHDASDPVSRPGSTPQKHNIAGPLIGLSRDEPRPSAGPRRTSNSQDGNTLPDRNGPAALVNIPFIVDQETRRITKFGQPCLVSRDGKLVPLSPKEFGAAALLIEHMGQYVSMETLCSRLQTNPAHVQRIMTQLRQALGLGRNHNPRGSSLVLMSDGYRTGGYGIFIAPRLNDNRAANDSPRGTPEALLSDLEAAAAADAEDEVDANLTVLSADDGTLVIRLGDLTAKLHVGTITGRARPLFYVRTASESPPSEQANDVHDVMIGWNADRSVYGLKRLGRSNRIANVLLDEAHASGLAYSLDLSADVEHGIFTVESMFAVQPDKLATALKQYLEHQRSQADGIPSNVTTQRDTQAMILQRLGVTRHGLPGVNPLPLHDLPAPLPPRALLYVNQIAPHKQELGIRIRPWFDGRKQGPVANFHQREGVATLVLGLYELDDTTLVVAWDPASHPEFKETVLSVDDQTLRLAIQRNDVVSQTRHQLTGGHSEEVLAAPLEHLDKLIEARLRIHPKQRMIDALGGNSCVREHLNAHTWTMVVDGRLFHVQWCGPLLRGDAPPHIRPFSTAERFVAPDPDAVALYAGHDPRKNVVVLWRQAPGENMQKDIVFSVPDSTLDEAARTGMATHVTHIGRIQLALREAVAAKYETGPLTSALSHLSREPAHREIWRSRNTDIHEQLFEHLQPVEWPDWEQTRTRPWPITVELPELGAQLLDVFAYRAKVSDTQTGSIAIVIKPGRTSFFTADRKPVLLGEWDGIYVLFDPRVRPTIKLQPHILITASRDHLETARTQGLALMTRQHRYGEFEETIIFATGERLLEALDLRLRTLPKANFARISERLDINDPQALAQTAMRLQHALRLPDRDALTGTRDAPRTMVVVTGPPNGIEIIDVKNALRRALQTKRTTNALLWLHSPETERSVLLHAGLRAVLQMSEGLRWPEPAQFDVLWALMQAAAQEGTVSDELAQTACRNSLQWLFIGRYAPLRLHRQEKPGSYQVRVHQAIVETGTRTRTRRAIKLPAHALDRVFNHASLFAPPRARPDVVWAFIKKVGPARVLPKGSGDDVVLELDGQRIWVYGLTKTLHRSEDGQTDYVVPALSLEQLSKIESNPNDQHVLAAFDPGRGNHAWVFWSARPHLDRLHDPEYRLHVSTSLPENAAQEWRQLDENREERVVIYRGRGQRPGIPNLLKQLTAELPQEQIARYEAQASKSGLTLGQVLSVMSPIYQISMAMRHGLAPYDKRYGAVEIQSIMGYSAVPTSTAFQHAAALARACLEAGEPLPELAEIIGLLRDPRASQYVRSPILLTMLLDLHGLLEPRAKPATLAHAFSDYGLSRRMLNTAYRELIMHLIRGANKYGVSTVASFDIGTPIRAGESPASTQIEIEGEADPAMPPSTQPAAADDPTPEGGPRVARNEIAAAIAQPDNEQLATSYASAVARLSQAHGAAWPPDVALPVALAQLPPDVELIMRAYLGVWPYRHRYTVEQVTTEFNIRTQARSRLLIDLASDELFAHAESLSGIVLPAKEPRSTLERLATLLIDRSDALTDDELNAVLTRHGLAAVAPLVTEATRRGVSSEFRPSRQYRSAVRKLTGEAARTEETDEDGPYWSPELIDEIYKRIDAGEYARLLLLLRDPATRDETFSDMVVRGAVTVDLRAAHRSSAMRGKRLNTMERRYTSPVYEDAVTRALGADSSIETFLQRADTLDAVLDRALTITDEEVPWLQRIVDDGDLAYKEFFGGNMGLARFAALHAGYADDTQESGEILNDAISGLQRGIWGYNPKMSLKFSNYAVFSMRSVILRQSAIRYRERFGVSVHRAQEIMMTRVARARLREQANASEQRREPSLEELARAVLQPLLRARLVHRLNAEPTATQLRAGWRKYMPEFLRRIEENVEFVNGYDQITRAASLDRRVRDGDDRTLHDIAAPSRQEASALPGDEPNSLPLAGDLKATLNRVGLSEREQFVLRHHFGIAGYMQLPMEEIAARQGISEDDVPAIVAFALAQIQQSSEARMLLLPYLHRGNPHEEH